MDLSLTLLRAAAIGAVAGWQARDRIAVKKALRKRWRRFKATPAFWGR